MSARPPEKDALQEVQYSLNRALSTRSNAQQLGGIVATKGWLSEDAMIDICGSKESEFTKVSNIMNAVRASITLAGLNNSRERITKKFDEFVLVLHDDLGLKDVAQDLVEACSKWLCHVMSLYKFPLHSCRKVQSFIQVSTVFWSCSIDPKDKFRYKIIQAGPISPLLSSIGGGKRIGLGRC